MHTSVLLVALVAGSPPTYVSQPTYYSGNMTYTSAPTYQSQGVRYAPQYATYTPVSYAPTYRQATYATQSYSQPYQSYSAPVSYRYATPSYTPSYSGYSPTYQTAYSTPGYYAPASTTTSSCPSCQLAAQASYYGGGCPNGRCR